MKNILTIASLFLSLLAIVGVYLIQSRINQLQAQASTLAGAVISTASSDTLETFRTNVNTSLSNLQSDNVSTTTAYTWTALQKFFGSASTTVFSANYGQFGGTATTTFATNGNVTMSATTTIANSLGVASTSPFTTLSIGNTSTSTISGNFFCAYFKDEAGRGMWIKLATSGNAAFSTSTTPCNI